MKVLTTGMPCRRENSRSAAEAPAADHAIAGEDQREGGRLDELSGGVERGAIRRGRRVRSVDRGVPSAVSSATSSGTSMWQAPGFSDSASLNALRKTSGTTAETSRRVFHLVSGRIELDDVHVLVRFLVDAVPAALTGDGDQRRAVEVGVGDPVARLVAPGPSVAGKPCAAGEPAPDIRHEGGALLVPRGDELDPRVHQGVDDVEDLLAGDTEDVAHAFILQTPRNHVGCLHAHLHRQHTLPAEGPPSPAET